jgi:hypothetical protein
LSTGSDFERAGVGKRHWIQKHVRGLDRREYPVKGHVGHRVEIFDPEDADYQQQLERGYATAAS